MHHQVRANHDSVKLLNSGILVVIDPSVEHYQSMVDDLAEHHQVCVLSPNQDGITQITRLLEQLESVNSLHVVSHGTPGAILLGNSELSLSTISHYAPLIKTWFKPTQSAAITLYGCNVAMGDAGEQFLNELYSLTNASIAASRTLTGHSSLGGSWDLTYHLGHPANADSIFSPHFKSTYQGVLATPVTTLITTNAPGTATTISSTGIGDPDSEFDGNTTYTTNFGQGDDILLLGFEVNIGGVNQTFSTELGGLTLESTISIQRNAASADANTPFFALQNDPRPDPASNPQFLAPTINIIGSEAPDDASALNGDIINRGIEAVFVNQGQSASNIERLDYVLNTPVRTTDANELESIGFLIVERGGNDSFQIAPILAIDGNNDPTAYGDLITVNAGDFGATDQEILSVQYTQETGDPTLRPDNIFNQAGTTQNIGAVFISWDDLGIDANENVFGYSLFAPDTNPANGDLLDVNSGAFPTNTTGVINGSGNSLDPIAGGLLFVSDTVDDLVRDTDQDGIDDDIDLDDDDDGILDVDEGINDNRDTDEDGIPDYLDIDSDNDGIPDNVEAQTTAGYRAPIPAGPSADTNDNGINDAYDPDVAGSTPITLANLVNTDGDALPDYLDLDSDGDGLTDAQENNEIANAIVDPTADADGDGLNDVFDSVDNSNGTWDVNDDIDNPSTDLPNEDGNDTDVDYRTVPDDGPTPGQDSDDDGIPDIEDLDDDNDGILDTVENNGIPDRDTDGDGIPDTLDLDSDNDGILDAIEAGHGEPLDADGRVTGPVGDNGFLDDLETGPENGIANYTPEETDGDGIPDFQDLDSDNDSIPDVTESGSSDPDEDGIIGTGVPVVNEDGVANDINPAVGGTPPTIPNQDGDDLPDYLDTDSNDDGTTDLEDALGEAGRELFDPDGNGRVDGDDNDDDGITDSIDRQLNEFGTGPAEDTDDDGIIDIIDLDDDNDGILDEVENRGTPDLDTDGDGVPDRLDLDADNDGILDIVEAGHTEGDIDGDGRVDTPVGTNGFADGLETAPDNDEPNYTPVDTDDEGVPDFQDLDSDNDGVLDVIEGGNIDPDEDGLLGDGTPTLDNGGVDENGISTARQAPDGSSFNLPDIDTDGIFDFRELDSDDDGIVDLVEGNIIAPDANNDGVVDGPDTDGDGIVDPIDRREGIFGTAPEQDTDDDGIPDSVDLDDDNDGILDEVEENGVPGRDTDGDGIPDIIDLDSDNDGILDVIEAGHGEDDPDGDGRLNGPFGVNGFADILETGPESGIANYTPDNTDGDGVPDFQDLDSDNDSIPDVTESDGSDPDQDGIIGTGTPVVNDDGIANDINPLEGGTPSPVPDTDGDTIPDYQDLDTDNDGIFDLRERGGITLPERRGGQVIGVDTDGDGIVDTVDGAIGTFGTDPALNPFPQDRDTDDIPDYRDIPSTLVDREVIPGDQLFGLSDPDIRRGDSGNNSLIGGSSRDTLIGRGGDDTLIGGSGRDTLRGGSGNDFLNGGSGDDVLRGNGGRDVMSGGTGKDRMFGGGGRDLMSGGSKKDIMFGGSGKDEINGNGGNDRINGEGGKDILTGGQGRDVFIFDNIREVGDTVTDFELTKDRIRLRRIGNGITSFSDISITQSGDDALIGTPNGTLIVRLSNIEAADLNSSHFIV